VRAIFTHKHDKTAAPLMARGQPRPISERGIDGSIESRLEAELTLPRAVIPGVYELARLSYETAGGQLGHLPEDKGLANIRGQLSKSCEPADTPDVVDITFADS
jgi:hypothetical protein